VLICHCAACQHRTGAPFSYCAYFERSKVQLAGPSNCYYFRPDRYGIAATLFDEKSFSSPALSIWEENKCDWVVLPDGMTHLQKQPVG
jgi:hypothetical protein